MDREIQQAKRKQWRQTQHKILIIIDFIYTGLKPYIYTYTSMIHVYGNPLSFTGPSLKMVQNIQWYVQGVQVKMIKTY